MYSAVRNIIFIGLMIITPVTWAVSSKDIEAVSSKDIEEKLRPSTIFIKVKTESATGAIVESSGSGFVVSPNHVLTAKHVISLPKDSKRILKITGTPQSRDGSIEYVMEVQDDTSNYDVALLRLKDTSVSLPPVPLGDPTQISINGSMLTALGFPLHTEFNAKSGKLTGKGGPGGTWITDIALNPGDSGGPVFNEQGQVVGMVVSALKEAEGIKYVLPINFARNVLSPFGIEIPKAADNRSVQVPAKSGDLASSAVVHPSVPEDIVLKPVKVESSIKSPFKDCSGCPKMVVIPAGEFQMGSNTIDYEKPIHSVSIEEFALGKTEITQGQWRALMGSNPSYFKSCGDDCPVERVSWDDAQGFIRKLNVKTGKQYRLPSEAEWEYACRSDKQQEYCGSDVVDSVAWHDMNSKDRTHPVGRKQPNAFGLYDMSGNVAEWVEDSWHYDYDGAPADGSVWQGDGDGRVLRGGSWNSEPQGSRAAYRIRYPPAERSDSLGFRVARMLP